MRAEDYMKMALGLAEKARDRTYPNPMVGAVIVKRGRVIGKGYHRKAGEDHAEVDAIKKARGDVKDATMYVTLEPCDHYGKTPPCTQAIIDSGIRTVHVACSDPNPLNRGRGIRKLRKAGVKVHVGTSSRESAALNKKYIKFITKGLPYVTVKLAQSLDGRIAASDGSSKWITSKESRKHVRKIRPGFDAIMIGANTAFQDDPFLLDEKKRGYSVWRVVVDSKLSLPVGANLIRTAKKAPVVIGTTELASKKKVDKFRKIKGVDTIVLKSKKEKVPLKAFLKELASRGVVNLQVEGGGTLAGTLVDEGLADEVMMFIAPKLIGGKHLSVKSRGVKNIMDAVDLKDVRIKRFDNDIMIHGILKCSQA